MQLLNFESDVYKCPRVEDLFLLMDKDGKMHAQGGTSKSNYYYKQFSWHTCTICISTQITI